MVATDLTVTALGNNRYDGDTGEDGHDMDGDHEWYDGYTRRP